MDFASIWTEIKEYVPVSAIIAAVFVAYLSRAIHRYDSQHGDRLRHEKIWAPLILSVLFTLAMFTAGFIPAKESAWNIAVVYCASSVYYQTKLKHKQEVQNGQEGHN